MFGDAHHPWCNRIRIFHHTDEEIPGNPDTSYIEGDTNMAGKPAPEGMCGPVPGEQEDVRDNMQSSICLDDCRPDMERKKTGNIGKTFPAYRRCPLDEHERWIRENRDGTDYPFPVAGAPGSADAADIFRIEVCHRAPASPEVMLQPDPSFTRWCAQQGQGVLNGRGISVGGTTVHRVRTAVDPTILLEY